MCSVIGQNFDEGVAVAVAATTAAVAVANTAVAAATIQPNVNSPNSSLKQSAKLL